MVIQIPIAAAEQVTRAAITLSVGDLAAVASIGVVLAGLLWFIIRQEISKVTANVALELVKSENRTAEKIQLKFAQKDITDLQMKELKLDVDELKKHS